MAVWPAVSGIEIYDDAMSEARDEFDLAFGKAGAAACDHIRDSGARDGDRIHVAFHQDDEIALASGFLGLVHVIQHVALGIDGSFGRVHVFGHVVAQGAAAEGDYFSGFVGDGKHDAAAETVVKALALVAREQAGKFQQFFGIFCFQVAIERVAGRRRIAQAEFGDCFAVEAAIFQVGVSYFSLGSVGEHPREKFRGHAMHFNQGGALLIGLALFGRAIARLGNRDAAFFGDGANRFRKLALLHFHHELENVAAHAAAEAVVNLLHGMDGERGCFLLVEWAEAGEILAAFFQAHVFADHADDVRLLLYAIRE